MAHEHESEMVNMALPPERKKEMPESLAAESPRYPYGLRISLDNDSLEKLGMEGMPEVGSKSLLYAEVEVTHVSQDEMAGEKPRKSLGLQITRMTLMSNNPGKTPEEALYGS